jgi:hypothetical protein
MKKILVLLSFFALAATPTFAQKVNIDYAHDYDFDKVKTFQYVETKDSNAKDQLVDGRIKDAIIRELNEGGLKQVESDPDLFVTYHVTTKDETVLNTTGFGYGGFGAGWGAWGWGGGMGMSTATTTSSTYTEGTLIIDAFDPGDKKMVWRGTGTVTVASNPDKLTRQIDNILSKLGKKWDKILKSRGK